MLHKIRVAFETKTKHYYELYFNNRFTTKNSKVSVFDVGRKTSDTMLCLL